jgi:hypothetical protein
MRVRVLADGTGARMAGKKARLIFFIDIDRAGLICVELLDEKVLGHCYLSEYLRGIDGICDILKVV